MILFIFTSNGEKEMIFQELNFRSWLTQIYETLSGNKLPKVKIDNSDLL